MDLIAPLNVLQIARFRVSLRALEDTSLPAFLGSTLRGTFGHALKAAVCIMPHHDCERCLVVERCLYPYLFETSPAYDHPLMRGQERVPHPFVIDPPQPERIPRPVVVSSNGGILVQTSKANAKGGVPEGRIPLHPFSFRSSRLVPIGETIAFDLILMGRGIDALPFVVYALSEMGSRGLGAGRGKFTLTRVDTLEDGKPEKTLYSTESLRIDMGQAKAIGLDDLVRSRLRETPSDERARLRFLTPARIRVGGDLQSGITFELLIRNVLRRLSLLAASHGSSPLKLEYRELVRRASEAQTVQAVLSWWDWQRYSNRLNTSMKLGGFVGDIEFQGPAVRDLFPLLVAGELLHVGTGTSFGLGRYEIMGVDKEPK